MTLTDEQINTIIHCEELCASELQSIVTKTNDRKSEFIAEYGESTGPAESDLTKLSDEELKTRCTVLGKQFAQITNFYSQIKYKMEKVDKEIAKR